MPQFSGNHATKYQDNPASGVRRIAFAMSVCACLCVGLSFFKRTNARCVMLANLHQEYRVLYVIAQCGVRIRSTCIDSAECHYVSFEVLVVAGNALRDLNKRTIGVLRVTGVLNRSHRLVMASGTL